MTNRIQNSHSYDKCQAPTFLSVPKINKFSEKVHRCTVVAPKITSSNLFTPQQFCVLLSKTIELLLLLFCLPSQHPRRRQRNNCGLPSQVELSSTTPDFLPHAFVRSTLCYYYYDLSFLFAVKAKSYKHALSYVKARDHAVPRLCTALLRRSRLLLSSKSRALYSDILRFSAFVMGRIGRGR